MIDNVLDCTVDVGLLYGQPHFAELLAYYGLVLDRLNVSDALASRVNYLSVLHDVEYNIEVIKVCEVVFVLQLNLYNSVLGIHLGHCDVDELVCSLHFLELGALFACGRNNTV